MSTQPTVKPLDPTSHPAGPDTGNGEHGGHAVSQSIKDRLKGLDEVIESAEGRQRSLRWLVLFGAVATLAVVGVGAFLWFNVLEDPFKDLEVLPATRGDVIFSVIDKGELEAANNVDIFCKVRPSGRGSLVASSIRWVVDNGTYVRVEDLKGRIKSIATDKSQFVLTDPEGRDITLPERETKVRIAGKPVKVQDLKEGDEVEVRRADVLMLLDDSTIKEQHKSQISIVAEKRAALINAQVNKKIVASQNEIDLQTFANNVKIADLDLAKYIEGDLTQKQKQIEGDMTLAQSDILQWRDKVMTGFRMLKKGFVTSSQAQSDEAKLRGAEIKLENLEEQKRVLNKYESERNKLDFENKKAQAEVTLKNTKIQAEGKEAEAESKLRAAEAVLQQEEDKLKDLEEDITNCTILAPSEGMVVYYMSEESRRGFSQQQSMVAVGESVRENQKLMRIPDLRHMQVQVKIHESLVPRLRADQVRKNTRGEDEILNPGQPGLVRVAAIDRPLRGHVKSVSPVSSIGDWMATDVKTYPTVVTVDESGEGLKPGMNAEVTILLDERTNVLRLPVHAVLEVAGERFCYVKTANGVAKRILKTGLNNNRFIEILEGSDLKEGELVVQTPRIVADKLDHLRAAVVDPADKLRGTDKGKKDNGNGQPAGAKPTVPGKPEGERRGPRGDKPGRGPGGFGAEGPGGPGEPGPGGPGAGPGGPGGQGGFAGGFQMTPEQRAQREKETAEFKDKLRKATPAERKKLLDERMADMEKRFGQWMTDPEQIKKMKEKFKEGLKKDGIEIPD